MESKTNVTTNYNDHTDNHSHQLYPDTGVERRVDYEHGSDAPPRLHCTSTRTYTSVSHSKELAGARLSLAQHCAAVDAAVAVGRGERSPSRHLGMASRDGSCAGPSAFV